MMASNIIWVGIFWNRLTGLVFAAVLFSAVFVYGQSLSGLYPVSGASGTGAYTTSGLHWQLYENKWFLGMEYLSRGEDGVMSYNVTGTPTGQLWVGFVERMTDDGVPYATNNFVFGMYYGGGTYYVVVGNVTVASNYLSLGSPMSAQVEIERRGANMILRVNGNELYRTRTNPNEDCVSRMKRA